MLQHLACKQLGEWLFGYFVFCGDCVSILNRPAQLLGIGFLGFQHVCLFVLLGLLGEGVRRKARFTSFKY